MKWLCVVGVVVLQGCSNLPVNIKTPPAVDIQYQQVVDNEKNFRNYPVRWGGTVIDTHNQPNESRMSVLFYPLGYYGRPKLSQAAAGRFEIVSQQFLDPAIFKQDVEITVAGTFVGMALRKIANASVNLPQIALQSYHIWPKYTREYAPVYRYPYYIPGYGYRHYDDYLYTPFSWRRRYPRCD